MPFCCWSLFSPCGYRTASQRGRTSKMLPSHFMQSCVEGCLLIRPRLHSCHSRQHQGLGEAICRHHPGTDHLKEVPNIPTIVDRITSQHTPIAFQQDTTPRQMWGNQGFLTLDILMPTFATVKTQPQLSLELSDQSNMLEKQEVPKSASFLWKTLCFYI